MSDNLLNIGFIGHGLRGKSILKRVLLAMDDVQVTAVCDIYEDRCREAAEKVFEAKGNMPYCTSDYKELINNEKIKVIVNTGSWQSHVHIAIDAMKAGKAVVFEVGGTCSIEECWSLVRAQEETKMQCMMLENVCYGRVELALLEMVRKGMFGDVVHCDGGYCHDLRRQIVGGEENRHYRLAHYKNRNCDNYPTHALGPIAKILNINRGNRMISLTSTASASMGVNRYAQDRHGASHKLANTHFAQGDIVTTNIKCAHGETITLRLDTTLPRAYSRRLEIHGTKGMYMEDNHSIYLDDVHGEFAEKPRELWGNADEYIKDNEHNIWREYLKGEIKGGHGGIDYLVMRAFLDSVKNGADTPIDVYDSAAWMCITALSEDSLAMGGMPVAIPDFTNGKWLLRKPLSKQDGYWSI